MYVDIKDTPPEFCIHIGQRIRLWQDAEVEGGQGDAGLYRPELRFGMTEGGVHPKDISDVGTDENQVLVIYELERMLV